LDRIARELGVNRSTSDFDASPSVAPPLQNTAKSRRFRPKHQAEGEARPEGIEAGSPVDMLAQVIQSRGKVDPIMDGPETADGLGSADTAEQNFVKMKTGNFNDVERRTSASGSSRKFDFDLTAGGSADGRGSFAGVESMTAGVESMTEMMGGGGESRRKQSMTETMGGGGESQRAGEARHAIGVVEVDPLPRTSAGEAADNDGYWGAADGGYNGTQQRWSDGGEAGTGGERDKEPPPGDLVTRDDGSIRPRNDQEVRRIVKDAGVTKTLTMLTEDGREMSVKVIGKKVPRGKLRHVARVGAGGVDLADALPSADPPRPASTDGAGVPAAPSSGKILQHPPTRGFGIRTRTGPDGALDYPPYRWVKDMNDPTRWIAVVEAEDLERSLVRDLLVQEELPDRITLPSAASSSRLDRSYGRTGNPAMMRQPIFYPDAQNGQPAAAPSDFLSEEERENVRQRLMLQMNDGRSARLLRGKASPSREDTHRPQTHPAAAQHRPHDQMQNEFHFDSGTSTPAMPEDGQNGGRARGRPHGVPSKKRSKKNLVQQLPPTDSTLDHILQKAQFSGSSLGDSARSSRDGARATPRDDGGAGGGQGDEDDENEERDDLLHNPEDFMTQYERLQLFMEKSKRKYDEKSKLLNKSSSKDGSGGKGEKGKKKKKDRRRERDESAFGDGTSRRGPKPRRPLNSFEGEPGLRGGRQRVVVEEETQSYSSVSSSSGELTASASSSSSSDSNASARIRNLRKQVRGKRQAHDPETGRRLITPRDGRRSGDDPFYLGQFPPRPLKVTSSGISERKGYNVGLPLLPRVNIVIGVESDVQKKVERDQLLQQALQEAKLALRAVQTKLPAVPSFGSQNMVQSSKTDMQRQLLLTAMELWKRQGTLIHKFDELFQTLREVVEEEANLHVLHCEEKEVFRAVARFMTRHDTKDVPPAPSDLQMVRTVRHELEKRIIFLRRHAAETKKELLTLERDHCFHGPRLLHSIFHDDNRYGLMTNPEREVMEEELSLLRKKHKVYDILCNLMELIRDNRVEYYAEKAKLEREAELHMEMEENMQKRYTTDEVRRRQHDLLKRAFMNQGGGESPSEIVRRTHPPAPPELDPKLKEVLEVLDSIRHLPSYHLIFKSLPDTVEEAEHELLQMEVLEAKLERYYHIDDEAIGARVQFLLSAIRTKTGALRMRRRELDESIADGGGGAVGLGGTAGLRMQDVEEFSNRIGIKDGAIEQDPVVMPTDWKTNKAKPI